nr:tetratricopeptide repeat protein [Terrabacter sp. MAHUQ-38]
MRAVHSIPEEAVVADDPADPAPAGPSGQVAGRPGDEVERDDVGQHAGALHAVPAPRTVPRTVTRLVGWREELARVLGAAEQEDGPAPVVAVTGLGGMGKSTLAVEAAHLLRDRFPDGTLYLDFDSETGRAGISSVLALFLGLLGIHADAVPASHDARVALYRSVIDDRRILIVLDDVPGDLDVSALLPARASSVAILTSRHSLASCQPTVRVRLTGLADDDGAALLRDLLGPDRTDDSPDDVAALARECRGLPILLRVTAQRVAGRPDLTLRKARSTLSAEIAGRPGSGAAARREERTDQAVYAGLGLAEAPLPPEARAVLGDVSHLPFARVSRWLVAALAGGEVAGDTAVDTLHAACLLEPVVQAGRTTQFQLHDLVRLYARSACGDDPAAVAERKDAHLAAVIRRLLVLAEAHARAFPARLLPLPPPHLDPAAPCSLGPTGSRAEAESGSVGPDPDDPPSPDDALVFFRTEQDTILTCVRWAAEHDPAAAWRLLGLMAHHAQASVEPGLWTAAARAVHDALTETTPDGRRGRAHLMLAESLIRHEASDSKHAAPLAVRARRTLHLEGDQLGAVAAAVVIGRCQRANGRRAAAEEALGWAGATVDDGTPRELHGYVELAWGSLLDDYDELRPARTHLLRALEHLEGTGDWAGLATAQFALARVHRRLGEYEAGLPRCDVAMELFARLGDVNGRTAVLDTRADLLVHMGEPAAALEAAREAVDQAGQRRDAFMLHRAQRTVGRALAGLGRLDDAEEALRASVAGFEALVRPLSLAASLRDLGRVLQLVGRVDEARTIFLRERACLERAGLVDLTELDELISRLDARREGTRPVARRRRGRGA